MKFGDYIKILRLEKGIGQRELSRLIKTSAPYLNDIEKNKRPAPRNEIVGLMGEILSADKKKLYDLAGESKNSIPQDIISYISGNDNIKDLLRILSAYNLSDNEIIEVNKMVTSLNTKAIIIAAGMGTRLKNFTENIPKCMIDCGGKTLLQRQLESYKNVGIKNISLVRGYKGNKINYKDINYYENPDYENNQILNSLFYAEKSIKDNVIISYSDILFEPFVVKRLLESEHDISIVVDIDWHGYYQGRKDHPIEEAEKVIFDANNEVLKIGKILTNKNDVYGEFIGMLKLSSRGSEIIKKHFNRAKALFWDKPFQRAKTFQKAYITDMIQEMVDLGVPIHCVIIERGWKEIDTIEDYKKAIKEFEN
jgi:choline kinase